MIDLKICFEAWDRQPSGYIFICSKKGKEWKDYPFSYPEQAKEIQTKAMELYKIKADVYWSIWTFSRPKRREEFTQKSSVLYSDLDNVDPTKLTGLKPTIAWRSSTNRFQSLWYLKESLSPAEHKILNRNLSYYIEADRGGWDLTQVLRIPGSNNYKYNPPQAGSVMWDKGRTYPKSHFEGIPSPDVSSEGSSIGSASLGDFVTLLSRYRKKIPPKISRMLQYPEARIEVGHRSEVLWSIEQELVAAKIPLQDIVALIAGSAWNKYRGRSDEMKRITTEIEKVYTQANSSQASTKSSPKGKYKVEDYDDEDYDEDDGDGTLPMVSFNTFMGGTNSRPGWMIKDIWLRRSHGIIAGDPKTFKSTVAMDMAVSVASGCPLWDKYPVEDQGPVIIIQNENSDWIMRDRMEKIMASKGLVGKVSSVNTLDNSISIEFAKDLPIAFLNNYGFNFSDPLHIKQLEKILEDVKPALIMFDPLYLMFDGEMNSAKELNPTLQWLLDVKNKYNTSVMLIHHWNKGGASARGGQRMLGSVALHGWTESGLFLQAKESKASDSAVQVGTTGVAAGGNGVNSGAFGELILEREFRAAGILPKLQLEVKSGDDNYSCNVVGTAKDQSLAAQLFELLLSGGPASLYSLARDLGVSRGKVAKIVETDPSFTMVGEGKTIKVTIAN